MKERTLYFSVPIVKYPRLKDLLKSMLTTLTQRFITIKFVDWGFKYNYMLYYKKYCLKQVLKKTIKYVNFLINGWKL